MRGLSNICATREWVNDLKQLVYEGTTVYPRGLETREVLAYQSVVDMKRPVVRAAGRNLGYRFMAAEAAWILSGDDRVETISPYSRDIANYSDDGVTFFGAYGPKIIAQLNYVAQNLLQDPDSRQAVINIWREDPPKTKDVPCTLSVQWVIRDRMLHCFDTMRSSDIWLGHPYDIFNFSALSALLAIELRNLGREVELGALVLTAGSKHLYQKNYEGAQAVLREYEENPEKFGSNFTLDPRKFDTGLDFTSWLWELANSPNGLLERSKWR